MAGPNMPIVGAGAGQPTRPDFEAQAHQDALRPGNQLDIPKQTVGEARNPPHPPDAEARSGWSRSDDAFARGGEHLDGLQRWGDFTGGRRSGPQRGAVQVDNPPLVPLGQRNNVARNPEQWVAHAAALEELFRAEGEKYGIDAEIKLPGDGPEHGGPTGTGRRNQRRAFTLTQG